MTGFKGRSGRSFRARLALEQNDEGKWRVEFDEPWAKEGAKPPEQEDDAGRGEPTRRRHARGGLSVQLDAGGPSGEGRLDRLVARRAIQLSSCGLPTCGLILTGALSLALLVPAWAGAYGTVTSKVLGQQSEHERMTRAALSCTSTAPPGPPQPCFEPHSMEQLAGLSAYPTIGRFGAVGEPDRYVEGDLTLRTATTLTSWTSRIYLVGRMPKRSRAIATADLQVCMTHLARRVTEGLEVARALTTEGNAVNAEAVGTRPTCRFVSDVFDGLFANDHSSVFTAKCDTLGRFGRVLHGVQDFYSHSNWSDTSHGKPGIANPPGLRRRVAAPFLDLRGPMGAIPRGLTTGCFELTQLVHVSRACFRRVRHSVLNKDGGFIDPRTGEARAARTPRGRMGNFGQSVALAIKDTRRQWKNFAQRLRGAYGETRGDLMACVLTHDDPAADCKPKAPVQPPASGDGEIDGTSPDDGLDAVIAGERVTMDRNRWIPVQVACTADDDKATMLVIGARCRGASRSPRPRLRPRRPSWRRSPSPLPSRSPRGAWAR